MHNWRLLLFAFIAVLRPIASFTEHGLVDGRQYCCDHQSDSQSPDTRLSLDVTRRIHAEDRRHKRHDVSERRLHFNRSPVLIIRERVSQINSKNEDTRLPLIGYRLTTELNDHRSLRYFEVESSNRRPTGNRYQRNLVVSRNDVDSSLRLSRDRRSASTDVKNARRVTSDIRKKILQKKRDINKLRSTTTKGKKSQTTGYEVEEERLEDRNNLRNERRRIDRFSSSITLRVHNIIQNRRFKADAKEFNKVANIQRENRFSDRRQFRKSTPFYNTVTGTRGDDDRKKSISNNRFKGNKVTFDRRLHRYADSSNARDERVDITRRNALPERRTKHMNHQKGTRAERSQSKENSRYVNNESRKYIFDDAKGGATKVTFTNSKEYITNDVSIRDIEKYQEQSRSLSDRVQRRDVTMSDRSLTSRDEANQRERYSVSKDRNRENVRLVSNTVKRNRDTITREVAIRVVRNSPVHTNVKRGSSDIRNEEHDAVWSDNDRHKSSPSGARNENSIRRAKKQVERRQITWRVVTQVDRSSAHREPIRNDFRSIERNMRRSENKLAEESRQFTRDSGIRYSRRDIRDSDVSGLVQTRTQTLVMLGVDSTVRKTIVTDRESTRRGIEVEDRIRKINTQHSSRGPVDIRQPIINAIRKDSRDPREQINGKLRTEQEKWQIGVARREVINEYMRDRADRESARGRSLDRMNFSASTRNDRFSHSGDNQWYHTTQQSTDVNMRHDQKHRVSRLHRIETASNRNMENEELTKITENVGTGNWQMLFHILQGFYICGVIIQAFKDNGSAKNKSKNQYWWSLASQQSIKGN